MPHSRPHSRPQSRNLGVLRLIAAFRVLKALLLLAGAAAAWRLLDPAVSARVREALQQLPYEAAGGLTQKALAFLTRLTPKRIEELGLVAVAYAALFLTEAVGLWLGRRWAEYLTIVATASFLPFELYEIVHKATALRIGVFILNVAVLVYLVVRVRRERSVN